MAAGVERDVGRAGHGGGVVVLDDEHVGMAGEQVAQDLPALGVEGGAGRVLAAGRADDRLRAAVERAGKLVGDDAVLVDGGRVGRQPEGAGQVGSSTATRSPGRSRVCRMRSMPSSAPPATAMSPTIWSAAKSASASSTSRASLTGPP